MKKASFRKLSNGADNGTRTRGLNLGKVALYQLSYVRNVTLTGNRGIHYPTACTNGTKIATRLKFRGIGHRSLLLTGSPPKKMAFMNSRLHTPNATVLARVPL